MADGVLIGQASGDNDLTTSAGTSTSGSTFVVAVSYISSSTILSVTDNKSNTYTLIDTQVASNGHAKSLYRCENGTGGASHQATVAFSGSSFGTAYLAAATAAAAASFDVAAKAEDAASPYTVTLPTLAQADEVIFCLIGNDQGGTVTYTPSNMTQIGAETDGNAYFTSSLCKAVVASTAAFTPSFTESANGTSALVAAAFKAAAASGINKGVLAAYQQMMGA